jgi:hypothetical protein
MINGREVRGAHLITAVDHPRSFWERGLSRTKLDRQWAAAVFAATERAGFVVNDPSGYAKILSA